MGGPEERPGDAARPPGAPGAGRRPFSRPVIVAVVAASLVLAGIAAASAYLVIDRVRDEAAGSAAPVERRVSVFFCAPTSTNPDCGSRDATEQEKQAVKNRLEGMPEVRRIEYESKEQAYQRFKRTFKDREELLRSVGPGDVPDSFRLWVAGTESAEAVKAAASGLPGVDSVVIQPQSTRA